MSDGDLVSALVAGSLAGVAAKAAASVRDLRFSLPRMLLTCPKATFPSCARRCPGLGWTSWKPERRFGTAMYGSVENLIEAEVKGTPLADRLSDDQIAQILTESTDIFVKFLTPAGELEMPIRAPCDGPQALRSVTHVP